MPRINNFEYQIYWRSWAWPWHEASFDKDFNIWFHFAGIGPLQFHWYSNKRRW